MNYTIIDGAKSRLDEEKKLYEQLVEQGLAIKDTFTSSKQRINKKKVTLIWSYKVLKDGIPTRTNKRSEITTF